MGREEGEGIREYREGRGWEGRWVRSHKQGTRHAKSAKCVLSATPKTPNTVPSHAPQMPQCFIRRNNDE